MGTLATLVNAQITRIHGCFTPQNLWKIKCSNPSALYHHLLYHLVIKHGSGKSPKAYVPRGFSQQTKTIYTGISLAAMFDDTRGYQFFHSAIPDCCFCEISSFCLDFP